MNKTTKLILLIIIIASIIGISFLILHKTNDIDVTKNDSISSNTEKLKITSNKTSLNNQSSDKTFINYINSSKKQSYKTLNTTSQDESYEIKLLSPENNNIYFGAFPDFGGPEDNVTKKRIEDFEKIAGKKIAWAYFSQNWFNGIKYHKKSIHIINNEGITPFVRFMPRSDEEQFKKEKKFTLDNIIYGKFDKELKQWAKDSKEDNIPLLADFAVEMNGDWFSWSGIFNGKGTNNKYGDPNYPDGPEKYRDAYRHIIDIFRKENVTTITWFFHPDIYSNPDIEWNQPKYYYPGDDYIDWIGVSIYGPLHPKENYWENFSEILENRHKSITEISQNKPIALLEFGVTDHHPLGKKDEWLDDAFKTILNNPYINFSAISYWHENWEEEDNLWATLRIDSSQESFDTFKKFAQQSVFLSKLQFSNSSKNKNKSKNTIKNQDSNGEEIIKTFWYKPKPKTSWQWQLQGNINTSYDVDLYDIDLFDTPQSVINELHNKNIKVICYFSAGSSEDWRKDFNKFPKSVLGNDYEGWIGEKWLDVSNYEKFKNIIIARLDLAVKKNCDGIEPDNIQNYQEDTGFSISYQDQLHYDIWLSNEAHKRNLSIALKNDGEQVNDLIDYYDFAIVENCFEYNECDPFKEFIKKDKAVLGVEYNLNPKEFCEKANHLNFSWLKMDYNLDGNRISCN